MKLISLQEKIQSSIQKSQAINRKAFDKYISLTIKYTDFLLAEANTGLGNG